MSINYVYLLSDIYIYTHLKLCLATATHNFKWVKITCIWLALKYPVNTKLVYKMYTTSGQRLRRRANNV